MRHMSTEYLGLHWKLRDLQLRLPRHGGVESWLCRLGRRGRELTRRGSGDRNMWLLSLHRQLELALCLDHLWLL